MKSFRIKPFAVFAFFASVFASALAVDQAPAPKPVDNSDKSKADSKTVDPKTADEPKDKKGKGAGNRPGGPPQLPPVTTPQPPEGLIANVGGGKFQQWDTIRALSYSPDGKALAVAGDDGAVQAWDLVTGTVLKQYRISRPKFDTPERGTALVNVPRPPASLFTVSFSPNGKLLAGGGPLPFAQIWDLEASEARHTLLGHENGIVAVAFSPDSQVLVTASDDLSLKVWDAKSGEVLRTLSSGGQFITSLSFSPDGRAIAWGGWDGTVRIVDPFGVRDPDTWIGHDDIVTSVQFSTDGRTLVSGSVDRTVRVWDVSTREAKLEHTVENHADWVLSVTLSEDGRYLFTASRDKSAKVWDLVNKQSVVTFADHQSTVNAVAAGPGGKIGYSVGADRLVRSWKLDDDGRQLKSASGHDGEVLQIAFSPKGSLLVTASADKTVRLWGVRNPDAIVAGKTLSLTDHAYSLAFHPEGTHVAAGSYDGEILVWNVTNGTLVTGFNASPGQPTKYVRPR